MRIGQLWAAAVAAALPVVALGQRPPAPVTITNTPLPVQVTNPTDSVTVAGSVNVANTASSPVPVTVQNPTSAVTVSNGSGNPVPVVQQGTASVSVSNTPTVLAKQSGAWSVQTSQPTAADYFELSFGFKAPANNLGGSAMVTFPRPALVEQVAALCGFTTPAVLSFSSGVGGVPPGFGVSPDTATIFGQGFRADLNLPVSYPEGWAATTSLPPTRVQLLVTSSVSVQLFRALSDAANERDCFVYLFGRWLGP